jgi:hypothetical protein
LERLIDMGVIIFSTGRPFPALRFNSLPSSPSTSVSLDAFPTSSSASGARLRFLLAISACFFSLASRS